MPQCFQRLARCSTAMAGNVSKPEHSLCEICQCYWVRFNMDIVHSCQWRHWAYERSLWLGKDLKLKTFSVHTKLNKQVNNLFHFSRWMIFNIKLHHSGSRNGPNGTDRSQEASATVCNIAGHFPWTMGQPSDALWHTLVKKWLCPKVNHWGWLFNLTRLYESGLVSAVKHFTPTPKSQSMLWFTIGSFWHFFCIPESALKLMLLASEMPVLTAGLCVKEELHTDEPVSGISLIFFCQYTLHHKRQAINIHIMINLSVS